MKLKGTNVTGRDRGTRKANGQWPMCPGLLSYLGFNVMGALSLLLVLLLTPGEGGGGGGSLSVPVFLGISTKPNPTKFQFDLKRATCFTSSYNSSYI